MTANIVVVVILAFEAIRYSQLLARASPSEETVARWRSDGVSAVVRQRLATRVTAPFSGLGLGLLAIAVLRQGDVLRTVCAAVAIPLIVAGFLLRLVLVTRGRPRWLVPRYVRFVFGAD